MNLLRSIFYAVYRMMCLRTPRLPHASHWQNNRVACLLRPSPEDRDTDAEVWSPNSYTRGPTAPLVYLLARSKLGIFEIWTHVGALRARDSIHI